MTAVPRLVFFDGLPGSGKSTTAQRIWLHLRRRGRPARWYFEHDAEHPIFDDDQVRLARAEGPAEPNAIFARALERYATLAADLGTRDESVLLESTLFQTAVGTQLLMDLPVAEIERHFDRSMALVASLRPALVYLRAPDVGAALRGIAAKRGDWFPEFVVAHLADTPRGRRTGLKTYEDAIAVFAEHRAICDRLLPRFPGERLTVDPSAGDWPRIMREVTQFLGLPPMTEPAPGADLPDYAGRYRSPAGDELQVATDERGLFLESAGQPRLWPLPDGRFALEGLNVEIGFERDAAGRPCRARCVGALHDLAGEWDRV
jgi:hypothetical protein